MKGMGLIALIFVVGCGPHEVTKFNATKPPPTKPEGTWRTHEMTDIGCTIDAPTEWRTPREANSIIDMSQFGGEGERQLTDEQMKNDLHLPDEMIKQQHEGEKLPDGVSLLLSKRIVGETDYPTQIEVKHKTVKGGTTVKAQADEVANIYMGDKKRESIQLPVGPAEVVKAATKSVAGETGYHIHYILVDNEDVYVITLQTEQQKETITEIAQGVAESFRKRG